MASCLSLLYVLLAGRTTDYCESSGSKKWIISVQFVGSYSDSFGIDVARRDIASYITQRDGGIASDYNDVFLSTGASDGIKVRLLCVMTRFCALTLLTG